MAKTLYKDNPLDRLTKPLQAMQEEPMKQEEPKKKVGRKKTKDVKNGCKMISLAVPNELAEKLDEIKVLHGNTTDYILKLIRKDLVENYDEYKTILELINKL